MNRICLIEEIEARVARITLEPGEISPRHYHSMVVENIVCLSGEFKIMRSGSSSGQILSPGQLCEIPPKEEHYIINTSNSPSEYLLVQKGDYDFVQVYS